MLQKHGSDRLQLIVRALFGDALRRHDHDPVGGPENCKAMGGNPGNGRTVAPLA
jgi:hypothetical protein